MITAQAFYASSLFIAAIIELLIAFYTFSKRRYKGSMFFSLMNVSLAIWSMSSAHEALVYGIDTKIIFGKIAYLGIVAVGSFWLLFILRFCQYNVKILKWVPYPLFIVPLFVLLAVWTNELHGLVWTKVYQLGDAFSPVIYEHGPIVTLFSFYEYALFFLGGIILLHYGFTKSFAELKQIKYILFAAVFPVLFNITYLFLDTRFQGYDITPLSFVFTGIILAVSIFRHKFYAFLPAAKEMVYKSLESGIVILNEDNVILDINPAARLMLDENFNVGVRIQEELKDQSIEYTHMAEVLLGKANKKDFYCKRTKSWVEIHIYDMKETSDKGKIVFFYDVTEQKKIQQELQDSQYLLSSVVNFLPDATFVVDKDQKIIIWNKAMVEMTKVKPEDIMGKGNYEHSLIFYGKRRPTLINVVLDSTIDSSKLYSDLKRSGDTYSTTIAASKDVYLWIIAKPLYDEEGNVIGAIESLRNVSDQKKTELELQDRLDTLLKLNDIMLKRENRLADLSEELAQVKAVKKESKHAKQTK